MSKEVVLLHGLARSKRAMRPIERCLAEEGLSVHNMGYPSTKARIETLAEFVAQQVIESGFSEPSFVTHSMGGIVLREIDNRKLLPNIGRVVMLAPPNQGSEVVNKIGWTPPFRWVNGPAGQQLGTDEGSKPNQLGDFGFECGIIAGSRSINWILSLMIPGKNDGKVSVVRANHPSAKDFRVIPACHPFIMKNREAIRLTKRFLDKGRF